MRQFRFISGEVYEVIARDEEHARQIIDAFFMDEYPTDEVEIDDIERIENLGAMTMPIED